MRWRRTSIFVLPQVAHFDVLEGVGAEVLRALTRLTVARLAADFAHLAASRTTSSSARSS
jgi:hypothetical protein